MAPYKVLYGRMDLKKNTLFSTILLCSNFKKYEFCLEIYVNIDGQQV